METQKQNAIRFSLLALALALFVVPIFAQAKAPKKPVVYAPRVLDGVPDVKSRTNYHPVAVMIDGHPAARPQSGLQQASLVYETLAEGGIPRFMAVYADMNVARIGPVRSVRPYFADYASEWHAAVAHAGGSPDGLKELSRQKLFSIEGIKGKLAKFFYRALGGGVHGLYTSSARLVSAMKIGKIWNKKTPAFSTYKFMDDVAKNLRGRKNSGVFIALGGGRSYDVEYRYDPKKNVYLRYTGHKAQKDRLTGKQVTVKNVVVLDIPKEKVLDRKGRLQLKTIGKGTGYLLQNGKATKITWTKTSGRARTVLRTRDGQEVQLVRGNTWFTIVPKGHKYKLL